MADVHSKAVRSYNMSRIRAKDTKPEMYVRKFLFSKGYRYKLHDRNLPGKPDIVLPKYRIAIFVHGCFWHGHTGCKYYVVPKTRTEWWVNKIDRNKKRDHLVRSQLKKLDWKIISVFECELKPLNRENTLTKILNKL